MCDVSPNNGGESDNPPKKDAPKEVSCILEFRPIEGWKGEYGFDWIRRDGDGYYDTCKETKKQSDADQGFWAMEYAYGTAGNFIRKVVYKKKDKAWIVEEFENGDAANGIKILEGVGTEKFKYGYGDKDKYGDEGGEIKLDNNNAYPLYKYIKVGSDILSLTNGNSARIYYGIDKSKVGPGVDIMTWGWNRTDDKTIEAHDFLFRDKKADIPYIRLEFTKDNYDVIIRYVKVEILNAVVVVTESGKDIGKYWYKEGKLHGVFFDNSWWKPEDFSHFYDDVKSIFSNRQKDFEELKKKPKTLFRKLGIDDSLLKDENEVNISELIKKGWKDIEIVIRKPKFVGFGDVPSEALGQDNCNVRSWQTEYEKLFSPQELIIKDKNEKYKYFTPTLSVPSDCQSVDVQVVVTKGTKPSKIYFKDDKNLVRVGNDNTCTVSRVDGFKLGANIKITNLGSSKDDTVLKAYDTKSMDNNPIGRLKIIFRKKHEMEVLRVRVGSDAPAQDKREDCTKNIMSQAGIELILTDYPLELDNEQQEKVNNMVSNNIYNLNDSNRNTLCDWLLKSLRNSNSSYLDKISDRIIIFVMDKSIGSNGFTTYNCKSSDGIKFKDIIFLSSTFELSTIAHELLHVCRCPHVFQMVGGNQKNRNDFCFPAKTTSNVMDYTSGKLKTSLHQYQWNKMIDFAEQYERIFN